MDKISQSPILRKWTYLVLVFLCLFALFWKGGEIAAGIAELVRAMQGR